MKTYLLNYGQILVFVTASNPKIRRVIKNFGSYEGNEVIPKKDRKCLPWVQEGYFLSFFLQIFSKEGDFCPLSYKFSLKEGDLYLRKRKMISVLFGMKRIRENKVDFLRIRKDLLKKGRFSQNKEEFQGIRQIFLEYGRIRENQVDFLE